MNLFRLATRRPIIVHLRRSLDNSSEVMSSYLARMAHERNWVLKSEFYADARRTKERLAAGDVDAVFFPFDESYPLDAIDEICDYVRKGGVLLQFGGVSMYRWVSHRGGRRTVGPDGRREQELPPDVWRIGGVLRPLRRSA